MIGREIREAFLEIMSEELKEPRTPDFDLACDRVLTKLYLKGLVLREIVEKVTYVRYLRNE